MTLKPLITCLFPNLLEPPSGESTGLPSGGGAGSNGGAQLTIGSKPLRNQPAPTRPGAGGDWLEIVAEEGPTVRNNNNNNNNNKENNVIEDVALRDIDVEAQSHQHHRPRQSNAATTKGERENKELGSDAHLSRGSIVEELPEFLRPGSRPYAKGDAASVSTQASLLGPEVTARSIG